MDRNRHGYIGRVLLVLGLWGCGEPLSGVPETEIPPSFGQRASELVTPLWPQADAADRVRILVQLRLPALPGRLSARGQVAEQQAITEAQGRLVTALSGMDYHVTRQFATIPFLALAVPKEALPRLQQRPDLIIGMEGDRLLAPSLLQSGPLVEADQAFAAGLDGTSWSVAVLDTGVDTAHPFLSSRVADGACFSANGSCPRGGTTELEIGSGTQCSYALASCQHGTHVAGIAAGSGAEFSGMARRVSIVAIQVFSRFTGAQCHAAGEDPCALSYTSDVIAGMEHALALHQTHRIAAVNLSMGGGMYQSTAECDIQNAAFKAAIDKLRLAGIATIAAAGNSGVVEGLSVPACISSAIPVGASTKDDHIAPYSNLASFLPLLAPGSSVYSSVPGGSFAYLSGTSMAAPHVAGSWALLRQKLPTAAIEDILNALRSTGLPIQDLARGRTIPRIRVMHALATIR